jgi:hypothetical protein
MVESLGRYVASSVGGKPVRQPLPIRKVVVYSLGIVAAFFVGTILEFRFRFTGYG